MIWESELYATIIKIVTEDSEEITTEDGLAIITEDPETAWTDESMPTTTWTSEL